MTYKVNYIGVSYCFMRLSATCWRQIRFLFENIGIFQPWLQTDNCTTVDIPSRPSIPILFVKSVSCAAGACIARLSLS